MADEAFALSPIAARPALPGEADYDAIREAFMETSRGRWFLGEYAKRNRNADTAMVLDAVARIEDALAAQRQERGRSDGLAEAVAALRGAVEEAGEAASAAISGLRLEEQLAPIHKGTRIIREISWRWREIGADSRICDLIDSQLSAIEASCAQITETEAAAAVSAAFDIVKRKLDEFGDETRSAKGAADAAVQPAMWAETEQPAVAEPESAFAAANTETAFAEPEAEVPAETNSQSLIAEPEASPDEIVEAEAPADMAAAASDAPDLGGEAADAHDEAVLEMVAIEMAAADPMDEFPSGPTAEAHEHQLHPPLPPMIETVVATAPDPVPPLAETAQFTWQATQQALPELAPAAAPEPSLGSTIIANGILQRPKSASDPLAPIRRMSQAERIAFFS